MRNLGSCSALIAICLLGAACGGSDSSPAVRAPLTTHPSAAEIATSIPGVHQPGLCDWYAGNVEILSGISCDAAIARARVVLADFPTQADARIPAVQLFIAGVCTAAGANTPMTYGVDELYIPALADAFVGVICPGDRTRIIAESEPKSFSTER